MMTALSLDGQFAKIDLVHMRFGASDIGHAQRNCDVHGPYMAKGTRLRTRDVWTQCPSCVKQAADEDMRKKAEVARLADEKRREQQLMTAAIPVRFIGRTLANFKAETPEQTKALNVARDFVVNWSEVYKKGNWLVFSGLPGTGKSHLAIAILQALMPAHVGRYMTCMELIQTIRATWRKDSEEAETELLDKLAGLPLLVIDEVGVQYGTDSEQNHLFDVLDRRYREMRPTILLTNQNKEGFKQFVGDRVYDRMTECAKWVPFTWGSYRPQARREMQDA
jgi:DNA replication protein DnaC